MAAGLAISVSLLTLVPYLLARQATPPGWVFSGFLVNPFDGFSYLAKMRQGFEGGWLFTLPYAAEPGQPALLFLFYLALGHFARLTGLSLWSSFHLARVLSGSLMFLTVYALLERLPLSRSGRWCAYALALGISGLGWIGIAVGVSSSDLLIPESVPWLAVLVNPHFPLAAAAICLGFLAALLPAPLWRAGLVAGLAGLVLGVVQPFLLGPLWLVLGAWVFLEFGLAHRERAAPRLPLSPVTALAACALTGAPWVIYDAWLVASHPVLREWSIQNLTPSPSPLAYLIGFGPLLAWGAVGLVRARPFDQPPMRLITLWSVLGFAVLYAPFGLQRRLSLGLAIPLVALAGLGIAQACRTPARTRLAVIGTLLLTLPSLLLVGLAGVSSASDAGSATLLSDDEVAAYAWMADHVTAGSLVLAAEQTGNRIPAWLGARVLAGHPFETPDAAGAIDWIQGAFNWRGDPATGASLLRERGIDFVYVGRAEQALGVPSWMAALTPVFVTDEVRLYAVMP